MAAVATKRRSRRNPEGAAESMYSSFHGVPSTVIDEFEEKEHYHSNLAALGELVGLKVRVVSGYDVTIGFDSGNGRESNPGPKLPIYSVSITQAKSIPSRSHGFVGLGNARKYATKEGSHFIAQVKDSQMKHVVYLIPAASFSIQDLDRLVRAPGGGFGAHENPEKKPNAFWPFDSFSRTTIYHVPSGHRFRTSTTHKGHTIYKSETKDGYVVPSIERDSVFDSVKDAKKFIDHWAKHSNPKGKGKRSGTGPFASSQRFVGDAMSTIYKPIDAFTGMVAGAADRGLKAVGVKGNKGKKRNPDHVLLTSNEKGTQLYLVGGQQDLDLASLKIDGEAAKKDLVTIGFCWALCYKTTKKWSAKEIESDVEYVHIMGKKETHPPRGGDLWEDAVPPPDKAFETGELPVLVYDRLNQRQSLVGGSYKIDQPVFGVSPGIEG